MSSPYASADGKIAAFHTANETSVLFYRKDSFDEAGLEYPPATAQDAWTWDEFVEVAKKLTKDKNGNDATSPDFDPNNVDTFGINFSNYFAFYSNGGSLQARTEPNSCSTAPKPSRCCKTFKTSSTSIMLHLIPPRLPPFLLPKR